MSTLIGLSRNHWVETWVCLEINSLAICFLISSNIKENKTKEEPTFIYLVTQILGSIAILAASTQQKETVFPPIMLISMALKIGV